MRLRNDLRAERQKEAIQRNTLWKAESNTNKLSRLDLRLGVGVGAAKQRKRLAEVQS